MLVLFGRPRQLLGPRRHGRPPSAAARRSTSCSPGSSSTPAAGSSGIRLLSAIFAVASIPLIAALTRRVTGRRARGARGARCSRSRAGCSLFHGDLRAHVQPLPLHERALVPRAAATPSGTAAGAAGRSGSGATLLVVASHPYGALVLGSQVVYVLMTRRAAAARRCRRVRGGRLVLGTPFWYIDRVARRAVRRGRRRRRRDARTAGSRARVPRRDGRRLHRRPDRPAGDPLPLRGRRVAVWRERRREALLVVAVDRDAERRVPARAARGRALRPRRGTSSSCCRSSSRSSAVAIVRRPPRLAAALTAVLAVGAVRLGLGQDADALHRRAGVARRRRARRRRSGSPRPAGPTTSCLATSRSSSPRRSATRSSRERSCRGPTRASRSGSSRSRSRPLGRGVWVLNAWTTSRPAPLRAVAPAAAGQRVRGAGVRPVPRRADAASRP